MSRACGTVYLVGAGPGDHGLITVRGRRLLREADIVVHDRLIGGELLSNARLDAEIVDVGKFPGHHQHAQAQINALMIDHARSGRSVVRLKGGDPFVFGRGWEEWQACRDAGVPCLVVPGVTSAIAAPASAGIPVTHRGAGRSFAVVTAHPGAGLTTMDFDALAKIDTVVVMMGRSTLAELAGRMIGAGRDAATPVACVERGATPRQRHVVATLATIAQVADGETLQPPIVTVIGEAAGFAEQYREHLASFSSRPIRSHEPLAGRRIVITRSRSTIHELRERLTAQGAITIECPLIQIDDPPGHDALDAAIRALGRYAWIVFASVHGVRGFFARLASQGRDTRDLAPCKIAAIGPITAATLAKRGITADLVPRRFSGRKMVDGILASAGGRPSRVLHPRGNIPNPDVTKALGDAGIDVDEVVAYHATPLSPPQPVLQAVRDGVDAVLLCSPPVARHFAELHLDIAAAAVACIGPTTAGAARASGLAVHLVAEEHTDAGLIDAVSRHFDAIETTP